MLKKSDRITNELRINCEHEAADLIEQQQREIEALESWNMDLKSESKNKSYQIRKVESKRDALAAHVEQVRNLYTQMTQTLEFADNGEGCYVVDGELMTAFDNWYLKPPQTSLAEVVARAVEDACGKVAHEVANSYSGDIDGVSDTERAWNDGANQTLRKFVRGFGQHANKIRSQETKDHE